MRFLFASTYHPYDFTCFTLTYLYSEKLAFLSIIKDVFRPRTSCSPKIQLYRTMKYNTFSMKKRSSGNSVFQRRTSAWPIGLSARTVLALWDPAMGARALICCPYKSTLVTTIAGTAAVTFTTAGATGSLCASASRTRWPSPEQWSYPSPPLTPTLSLPFASLGSFPNAPSTDIIPRGLHGRSCKWAQLSREGKLQERCVAVTKPPSEDHRACANPQVVLTLQ